MKNFTVRQRKLVYDHIIEAKNMAVFTVYFAENIGLNRYNIVHSLVYPGSEYYGDVTEYGHTERVDMSICSSKSGLSFFIEVFSNWIRIYANRSYREHDILNFFVYITEEVSKSAWFITEKGIIEGESLLS